MQVFGSNYCNYHDFKLSFDAKKKKKLFLDVVLRVSLEAIYLVETENFLLKVW